MKTRSLFAFALTAAAALTLGACTPSQDAQVQAAYSRGVATIKKDAGNIVADAASPQGQAVLADAASTAADIIAAASSKGLNPLADITAATAIGQTFEAASTLVRSSQQLAAVTAPAVAPAQSTEASAVAALAQLAQVAAQYTNSPAATQAVAAGAYAGATLLKPAVAP